MSSARDAIGMSEDGGVDAEHFSPLIRNSLSQQAYDEIRAYLMRGRLKPGQRLVSRTLASELGISTTPVREALLRLASEQALELDQRSTVIVPVLTPQRYEEIRDLRVELEGLAAERAARIVTAEGIAALIDLHRQHAVAEAERRLSDALAHNEEFHFTLCRQSGLPTLLKIVETLWLQCGPLLNLFYNGTSSVWDRSEHPHLRVISCLEQRDGAGARAAITADIIEGAKPILQRLRVSKAR